MNALEYFLKANLYLALFYACYYFGLRRHTFFGLNRAYLLVSVVAALMLPLVELSLQTVEALPVPVGVISLPVTALTVPVEPTGPDWEMIGYGLYSLVAAALFLRLLLRLMGIGRLIARSERLPQDGFTLVLPPSERVPSFSFFRYLVLNPHDARQHTDVVCRHELVHIRQWHSADVLFFELVQLLFWLNPVTLLYQRAIRQIHEFLADRGATEAEDSTQYATFLVEYAFSAQPDTLTNSFFNPALLKERIQMLQRRTTSRRAIWKYGLVLPLALGLLAMTSAPNEVQKLVSSTSVEEITVTGRVTDGDGKPLPGATIVVVGATRGTTTDGQGVFLLSNVPADGKLAVSFIGFKTQEVSVQSRKSILVNLTKAPNQLNDVVVVGYNVSKSKEQLDTLSAPSQSSVQAPTNNSGVFTVVEQQPEFPGGVSALYQRIAQNIRYPIEAREAGIKGRVYLRFVVGANGEISSPRILKGIGGGCDEEAIRVISQLPRWQPGQQNGKAVPVEYNMAVEFSLENQGDKRSGFNDAPKRPDNLPLGDFGPVRPADLQAGSIDNIGSLPRREDMLIDATTLKAPIYFLDGVRISKEDIEKVAPSQIEAINVIKGTAALKLYGEEGENGVVQITTKKNTKTPVTDELGLKVRGKMIKVIGNEKTDFKEASYYIDDKPVDENEYFRRSNNQSFKMVLVKREGKGEVRAYTK